MELRFKHSPKIHIMRILLKCPTRSRPQKVMETLRKYMKYANHPELIGVCVSADSDDTTMTRSLVADEIKTILKPAAYSKVFFGNSKSKIEAVNADMEKVTYPWDIVVLVSDDMIPQIKGYDDTIRNYMFAKFPDTDGILWFNDGAQTNKLNTLTIMGRKMYESFGYIYNPLYKSLFCDTEFTDLCNGALKEKCHYVDYCIIQHQHPGTGFKNQHDALYDINQRFWTTDMMTYINRKTYDYDWTIMIATIAGRESSLKSLLQSIHEKRNRICPQLNIQINVAYDNKEKSIGVKRQSLLESARGKYSSFIDDDDEVTDAYFEDAVATIQGNYHVCRLHGQMSQYKFVHSIETKLDSMMAKDGIFTRPPNHLNIVLATIAKFFPFGDATNGEDLDWTIRMASSGFLKNEYQPDPNRTHYIYNLGNRIVSPQLIEDQTKVTVREMLSRVWKPVNSKDPEPEKSGGLRLGARGFVSL